MASSISIGKIRYDIVSDTTKFNKGMKVTGAQIKQVDKAFRDHSKASATTRYELDRLRDTIMKNGGATATMAQQEQVLIARLKEEEALERRVAEARIKAGKAAAKSATEIAREAKSVDKLEKELMDLEKQSKRTFNAKHGAIGGTVGGSLMSVMGLGGVGGAAGRLGGTAAGGFLTPALGMGLAAGVAGTAGAVKSVATWARLQREIVDFAAIVGDERKADSLVSRFRALAKQTPLTTSVIIRNAKTLRAYGVQLKDESDFLRRIGDIAGGSAEKMNSLTLAIAQVAASGKLMGQERLQLINAGMGMEAIAKRAGVSMADFRKEMEAGNITFEHVKGAIEDLTNEGGLFANRMEKASKTISGSWDRMFAGFEEGFANLGESLSEGGIIASGFRTIGEVGEATLTALGEAFKALMGVASETGEMIDKSIFGRGEARIEREAANYKRFTDGARVAAKRGNTFLAEQLEDLASWETRLGAVFKFFGIGPDSANYAAANEQLEMQKRFLDIQKNYNPNALQKSKDTDDAFEARLEQNRRDFEEAKTNTDKERKELAAWYQYLEDRREFGEERALTLYEKKLSLIDYEAQKEEEIRKKKEEQLKIEQQEKKAEEERARKRKADEKARKDAAQRRREAERDAVDQILKDDAKRRKDAMRFRKVMMGAEGGSTAGADYRFLAQRQQHAVQNKLDRERNKALKDIDANLKNALNKNREAAENDIKIIQMGN